jgi:large subunit ribosomal protein L3
VFPGKKMAGHYGHDQVTIQNLEDVRVDTERGLLWIKGALPGAREDFLIVRPAVKG